MRLSSLQLEAFLALARVLNFSLAAKRIHISQSALSHRISNLEQELGLTLFVRSASGVRMTEAGRQLFRYCQTSQALENELIESLGSHLSDQHKKAELIGTVRVAGFSSVMRSVIIPSLSELIRHNPNVQCEFLIREMAELSKILGRAEADFVVMDHSLANPTIMEEVIGHEEYVCIEAKRFKSPKNVYIDLSVDDTATERFFKHQNTTAEKYQRYFMEDVYAIIDGVGLGIGRAVMPRHLLRPYIPVRVVKGFQPLSVSVFLQYHNQSYYSQLHQTIVATLKENCQKFF